jgi:hypothetical protein
VVPLSDEELASARVFVQRPGLQVPIDAEWHVLTDGRVLVRHRQTGGWEASLIAAAVVTADDGDWAEVTT